MKVIDLLNKIANGEEVPKKIRYYDTNYYYNTEFYYTNDGYSMYREMYENGNCMNDEVEILDEKDEFIDIEEFCTSYSLDYIDYRNIEVLKEYLNKDLQSIFDTLDKLIKNQKKIINKIKEEGK